MKSGPFWLGVISAVIAAVFAVLGLLGIETPFTQGEVYNVITLILMVPAALGIISDPITRGVQDSDRAMTYEEPGGEDI